MSKLLCSWNSPGKNTGVGCHFLLQGIFLTQGSNPRLLRLLYWQGSSLPLRHQGNPLRTFISFLSVFLNSSPWCMWNNNNFVLFLKYENVLSTESLSWKLRMKTLPKCCQPIFQGAEIKLRTPKIEVWLCTYSCYSHLTFWGHKMSQDRTVWKCLSPHTR